MTHPIPLVTHPTRSQSESVETVLNRIEGGEYFIPEYQRDSDQWTREKESRFIESILNNLTVPAFFLYEGQDTSHEIVDGQQRLSTLRRFYKDDLVLCDSTDIDYLTPQAIQYAGKKYSEIDPRLQRILRQYPLTLIFLPSSMEVSTKLEVFRRINEGGTPLTGQDIRLAYYGESKTVYFIRLVGVHEKSSSSSDRMIKRANDLGLKYPWEVFPDAMDLWTRWWLGKERSKGQTPSHMFLWYLVALHRDKLDGILKTPAHLGINFRGTIDEALDAFCSQLAHEHRNPSSPNLLPSIQDVSGIIFEEFAEWFQLILEKKIPYLSVEKYRQLATFIAVAVEIGLDGQTLTNENWTQIEAFISNPRESGRRILGGDGYPEPKGRWGGTKGQLAQFNKAVELVGKIV